MSANPLPRRARPRVGGLVPFSTVDYPGRFSAAVFIRGCPWRCGYCHNPELLDTGGRDFGWEPVQRLLARRSGLIDAVVFTGGEPTSDPALGDAMDEVRAQGFSVGLHTAGPYPRRLRSLLSRCDWVGFDVKAPFGSYDTVTGARRSSVRVQESLDALAASGVAYETRTTWHPALLDESALLRIADDLAERGVRRYALQAFRALGCEDESLCTAPRAGPSEALLGALASRFPQFTYRPAQ